MLSFWFNIYLCLKKYFNFFHAENTDNNRAKTSVNVQAALQIGGKDTFNNIHLKKKIGVPFKNTVNLPGDKLKKS